MKQTKTLLFGAAIILVVAGILLGLQGLPHSQAITGHATLLKGSSCGCCNLYESFLSQKTGIDLEKKDREDTSKRAVGIPPGVQSCHTLLMGDYFIEGHMPLEAIEKLMQEQPDIRGIALPEMPSGSPGMPGEKTEQWVIYAVHDDGIVEEFMTL